MFIATNERFEASDPGVIRVCRAVRGGGGTAHGCAGGLERGVAQQASGAGHVPLRPVRAGSEQRRGGARPPPRGALDRL